MPKKIYEIDGDAFSTLEEFYHEISRVLIPGESWGRNLDAFNDILRGGFGTPSEGFVLRWRNSESSRERLGYKETVRQLNRKLQRCHPTNEDFVRSEIALAERNEGPTAFDWLVEILRRHGPAGSEPDGIELVLD